MKLGFMSSIYCDYPSMKQMFCLKEIYLYMTQYIFFVISEIFGYLSELCSRNALTDRMSFKMKTECIQTQDSKYQIFS